MSRRVYQSILTLISLALVSFLTACGSGSSSTTQGQQTIAATSGTPQSAAVNTAFAAPLVATVTTGGSPTSGIVVTFTAPATGASGTFAGGVNTATTNASGVATSAVFTANGTDGGPYTVTASATGATGTASFSLTNTAGAAASITATSGTPQSAGVETAFTAPLVATVVDSDSNPVSGVTVTFTAPATGASGTFAGTTTTSTATTNANGVATSAVFTANAAAGIYAVTASVAGVSTPATFNLTNVVGAGATVVATSGTPQSAAINEPFASPFVVTVEDSLTNPVSGVVVTFTAPATGASGTFAGGGNTATATTNVRGVAISPVYTANGTVGTYTVAATAPGTTASASFSVTNTAQTPATITTKSGTPQSATVSTAFAAPLVAKVLDSGTFPVSGVVVTFTAPATGASGTFAGGVNTATTDANGLATSAVFTANGTAGAYSVTATVAGVSTPAIFSLTNEAGAAASITATSGTPQSATVLTAFAAPLVATVLDSGSNPVSGVTVTFTAPAQTGASGTFAGGVNTATTDINGVATSAVFTANATTGTYTVTATVAGVTTPANFSLTNTGANYAFYLSGLEALNSNHIFYALAGSVTVDGNGNVLAGEQDYNDGFGITSPQPSGDTITGGALTVDPTTGQGTLSLITNNTSVGVAGTETLGVQFVNTKHALIVQFDGTATSSGSMDYQTLSTGITDGNYAFTISGVDSGFSPTVFGGVFSVSNSGAALQGFADADDGGSTTLGTAFTGTASVADSFGRGTITGTGLAMTFNYYIVGPEVIRIIDVDPSASGVESASAVGSAFGQGAGTFTNASLGSSVFGIEASSRGSLYAAAGMFTTAPTTGDLQGIADDDELDNAVSADDATISGIYSIGSNGYGSLTIAPGDLGDISVLGIYMTDPALNLNDPNNTASGLGGALVADLDTAVNGAGILIPQTDTAAASFTGNNYAFGAQDYNSTSTDGWEFDFIGQGSVTGPATAPVLSGTGLVSDPYDFFSGTPAGGTDTGATFAGTAAPDAFSVGRYTMPLEIATGVCSAGDFQVIIYQSSGAELIWMENDTTSTFLGFLEQQGPLTGLPAVKKAGMKKAPTKKMSVKAKPQC